MSARSANCIKQPQNSSDSPHVPSGGRHVAFPTIIQGPGFLHAVLPSTQDLKIIPVSSSQQVGKVGQNFFSPSGPVSLPL